jgi:hypothetical protein
MTIYSYGGLPAPTTRRLRLVTNTGLAMSRLNRVMQTASRPGEHWELQYAWRNLRESEFHQVTGFLAQLNGQEHRATMPIYGYNRQGVGGGTPVVDGASQTGASLNVRGLPVSTSNWLRRGDMFHVSYVAANPDYRPLFMVTADVDTNGSGEATIPIRPALRFSPDDGEALAITTLSAHFILMSPLEWPLDARLQDADGYISPTIIAEFVEDVRGQ